MEALSTSHKTTGTIRRNQYILQKVGYILMVLVKQFYLALEWAYYQIKIPYFDFSWIIFTVWKYEYLARVERQGIGFWKVNCIISSKNKHKCWNLLPYIYGWYMTIDPMIYLVGNSFAFSMTLK